MKIILTLLFTLFSAFKISFAEDWPSWRGQNRDGISKETNLLKKWSGSGPDQIWFSDKAGLGYSGFTIIDDVLYTMGAFDKKEKLLALNAKNGELLWEIEVGELLTNGWGDGPRMSPTYFKKNVYALGGKGNLICVNTVNQKISWKKNLAIDLGGKVPSWGYTESVLIDNGKVICTPGGKLGTLAALDADTGKMIWRTKEFTDGAQYSSPISIYHQGMKQYVQLVMKNVVGVNPENGEILWKSQWSGKVAVIPTPIFSDGSVYITSGYGVGCKLINIDNNSPSDVYENKVMKNHHGGVIKVGKYLYGYSDGVGWVCQDFKSGELIWNEKKALGKGAIAYADNHLYCLGEGDGKVVLIEATPKGWTPKGEFIIKPQTEKRNPKGGIWTHPVINNGKLYLRDQEYILCYNIKR